MPRIDPWALIALLVFSLFLYRFLPNGILSKKSPFLWVSSLNTFKTRKKTFLEKFSHLPAQVFLGGLLSLALALLDPHLSQEKETRAGLPPNEGLALYLVLDKSGSMGKIVDRREKEGAWQSVTRINLLQEASIQLIQKLPQDLIGIISFARSVTVLSPLTLDHNLLVNKINKLEVVKDATQDGTSIGYAIYKTAHLIAASQAFSINSPYQILSAFMIVVTDGFQDPSILDKGNRLRAMELEEAAGFAKEKNIKLYIVNIDPKTKEDKFAPNRQEMKRAAVMTGGAFIALDNIEALTKILQQIPSLEKSKIQAEGTILKTTRIPFYPYLIALGLSLIAVSLFLNETMWRRSL